MPQEDLIKREIDQLGKVLRAILSKVLGLKNDGADEEVEAYAAEALKTDLGIDIDELINLPSEKLLQFLVDEKKLSNQSVGLLADVIYNLATTMAGDTNQVKADRLFQTALQLYETLILAERSYSFDWYFKVGDIKNRLSAV